MDKRKPNPVNIENLQEWMDMPLGSSQAIDDRLWWIIRVPGGWVLLATNGSCFVPEPKKEPEKDIIQKIKEQGFITGNDMNRLREREGFSGYKGPYPEPIECNNQTPITDDELRKQGRLPG